MKRFLLALFLLAGVINHATATGGYRIQLKMPDAKDGLVYLAHYYGKPMPTIYKADSTYFRNGVATFQSKDTIVGGIYILLLGDMQTYFELLLNNGDDISITAKQADIPKSIVCKNSPENERFQQYVVMLDSFGRKQRQYELDLPKAKTATDSAKIRQASIADAQKVTEYRKAYIAKYPGTLLTNIFNALQLPQVPEGVHYLEDGKTVDSTFGFNYYKAHYWDKFDFNDDRLLFTPLYDGRLEEYFTRLVAPTPDSMIKEANMLLAKTRGRKELFKYTLHWLASETQKSKIMGIDEVFVYLVENYYMKGDAYWMNPGTLEKYIDRAQKIAPNVIGNMAPEIKMVDINKKEHSLLGLQAKYTLLVFWSSECGSCLQEIPKLDSAYEAVLRSKGVKVYAVRTDGEEKNWQKIIEKDNITDWVNVYDPEHKSDYKAKYDVYGTPSIYLLDEKKIIRGKRLDHNTVIDLLNHLEQNKPGKS